MASKLLKLGDHEAKNQLESSLRQSFEELEPKLKPPFSLSIPNPQEYLQLNRAILFGVLTKTQMAKTYIKYLHAIVTDGYEFFICLLLKLVNDSYVKLVDSVKDQLIWVVKEMVDVLGVGFHGLLVSLLRQIIGGDFSDGNLWLCFELVSLFLSQLDCLLEEEPLVLTSAVYVFLRLLADHCRLSNTVRLESLKTLEIEFCVKMLREHFHLCMKIGRDLIRLLQDLVHVPAFQSIWKDLVVNPAEFRTSGFSDVSQLYSSRTSSRYFLLRITPEMETKLRFLLMHVKFGSQKRHQTWFAKKFLSEPERESLIIDIVRFVCCAHHPSNEIIQSDILPRWAVIGWLLKSCRKNHVQANVKLALFYDWLFFDERLDNVMNIEPGMLLMVCSIPKYIDMTNSLLEFLLLLVENYDVDHPHVILRGLSSALNVLVQKGVIRSMDVLTSCDALSPIVKERLGRLLSYLKEGFISKSPPANLLHYSVPPLSLQNLSSLETPAPSREQSLVPEVEARLDNEPIDTSIPVSDALVTCPSISTSDGQVDVENLLKNLDDAIRKSSTMGLKIFEALLLSFLNLDGQEPATVSTYLETLCPRIACQFESIGCKLFTPIDSCLSAPFPVHEIRSASSLITRTFILSQHQKMQEMLLFWSRNGFPVGGYLLSYASHLAYEAYIAGYSGNAVCDSNLSKLFESGMPLFTFHVEGYLSFHNTRRERACENSIPMSELDTKFMIKLVEDAFAAYKCFLECLKNILPKGDTSISKLLLLDIVSCIQWERVKAKFLFCGIFHYLPDLCIGEEHIIKLLISHLDHADIVKIQFDIGLKKFSLFGKNIETILQLMKISVNWDPLAQQKFWGLIKSELAVSKVEVEKIVLQFLSCDLDANIGAIAVGGLLTLCNCCAPTSGLVGAIMLLPDNVFKDFSATALATWAESNPIMLFDSLSKFSEELGDKNGDAISSAGVMINRSAVVWLLNYLTTQGMNASDILSKLSSNNMGG